MPKIDVKSVPEKRGSSYPPPFDAIAKDRVRQRLGDAAALTQFGVNLLSLPPGAASAQRHWHSSEDEFVYVLSGQVTLITDKGEEILRAGDCAGFPKGVADGHQIVNRSDRTAQCLEVGTRSADDVCLYSDIDLMMDKRSGFRRKDGTPYG
ncbi:MAG: cupin domain-containing protein [Alphaproteobacteria bacterium]|nr:cupin domain-containing protein [Alphaproteobacteria bacterium]MBV9692709.1 cupin domain-containing protein [Alphaproteobacteria bacterium]